MLRYEFLLQWRRRALSVIMLTIIALPVLAAVTFGREALAGVAVSGLAPERLRELVTQQMVPAVWGVLWMFLSLSSSPTRSQKTGTTGSVSCWTACPSRQGCISRASW